MNDKKNQSVRDTKWEDVGNDKGKIKFINSKRKSNIKKIVKMISFILVAVVSGGISGCYVANKIESNKTYTQNNQTLIKSGKGTNEPDKSEAQNQDSGSKNDINKVSELVGPTVVGISNKSEGYFGIEDTGSGSGIIVDSRGYIVTNYHVIKNADKVTVKLSSGKILSASVQGVDERSDLAVIKVNADNLPHATLGDSSKVRVGDTAIAIGNPLGEEFAGSVTAGIISALNRKIEFNGSTYKVIQTDAAINPGNSGGPLCNSNGEVIGINSLKMATENAEGMGFAISINEAKNIINTLMNKGKVARPYLGIYGGSVASEDNKVHGVYIQEVLKESGAAQAGIKPTDILLEFDGKKVVQLKDVQEIIDSHKVGDKVKCKILRNGNTIEVTVTLL